MSDRPWLGDTDPGLRLERELLKRLNAEQPPVGSVEQGWAALAAEIGGAPPIGAGAGGGATQAAAQGASSGVVAKVAIGVALLGGGIWAATELGKTEPPAVVVAPPQRLSGSAPLPPAPSVVPPPAISLEPSGNLPAPPSARRTPSATTLAEEGRILAEAHRLVQAGQPERALSVLRDSQRRYPRSVLSQEREVLTIEALYAGGASGAAKQRSLAFLGRHPKSPHAERLRRFVE